MSPAALHKTPEETRAYIQQLISDGKRNTQALKMRLQRWPGSVVDTFTTADADWSAEKIDMQDWLTVAAPLLWEDQGYPGVDGVMWYRKIITLNADEAANGIDLSLGRIDDNDITWVNGHQVGSTQAYDIARGYHVAGEFLKPGENTIAIRVEDTGGGGGIYSDENLLYLQTADGARRSLAGNWSIKADRITVSEIDEVNHVETALYNKMLYPLFKTPIKGVIWYQGEANANTLAQAENYAQQFPALIQDWRGGWQNMTLPFYWVQLANFDSGRNSGDERPWAILRESQTAALELANTGQAITIDVGNPQDIHPRDKLTVGNRLALIALNKTYGYGRLHYRGPVFESVVRKKDRIMVQFSTDKRLRKKAGEHAVTGFEIAANDGVYKAVTGKIKGNSVVIPTKDSGSAAFLRYAWNDNPEDAGLFDSTGLPAEPFRTAIPD
jgi:sialate O-acetylesterase